MLLTLCREGAARYAVADIAKAGVLVQHLRWRCLSPVSHLSLQN